MASTSSGNFLVIGVLVIPNIFGATSLVSGSEVGFQTACARFPKFDRA